MSAVKWETMRTAEQIEAESLEGLVQQIRAERNRRLAETDFYMLPDAPQAPEGLADYRQALRDVTNQAGFPEAVTWPAKP